MKQLSQKVSCLPGRLVSVCLLFIAGSLLASPAFAQPGQQDNELSWDRSIRPLVGRYCLRCHNEEQSRGDINLAQDENPLQIQSHFETWEIALQALRDEAMPPDDAPQPTSEERDLLVRFLESTLQTQDCENLIEPGKPIVRRLNRVEYDNTIFDLTGLELNLSDAFPPDPSSYGFDNIGDALTLSPVQVEQYDTAARLILAELSQGAAQASDSNSPQRAAFQRVFEPALDEAGNWKIDQPVAAARLIFERFASQAFRRPVEAQYLDRLCTVFEQAQAQQYDFQQSVSFGLRAILISPRFLMRVEQTQSDASEPYPVDSYDLASRLSFFLWSRPPDDQLLAAAADDSLQDPEVLRAQTLRMLSDSKSDALVKNFFGQWLELRRLDQHTPDPTAFPEFNETLRQAIRGEVHAILSEMIREDRSIMTVIDANFTYVNRSLAELYSLSGEFGDELQRIELADRRRGGLLTSAALLMLQSDPQRVNVPRRGNFIADRILGSPPPPPPPDVPSLESVAAGEQQLTLRERFELHRSKAECMSCHSRIDPLGFAFQNYDAIGRWQYEEEGKVIDASGVLPDGRTFPGPQEFKDLLLAEREQFTRTLSENLLVYALGRGLERADQCVIQRMLESGNANEHRFSSLVLEIVLSPPFRYRRNADD